MHDKKLKIDESKFIYLLYNMAMFGLTAVQM